MKPIQIFERVINERPQDVDLVKLDEIAASICGSDRLVPSSDRYQQTNEPGRKIVAAHHVPVPDTQSDLSKLVTSILQPQNAPELIPGLQRIETDIIMSNRVGRIEEVDATIGPQEATYSITSESIGSLSGEFLGTVGSNLFGGILINKNDFDEFKEDFKQFGMTFTRYPGGTNAERGIIVDGNPTFAEDGADLSSYLDDRSVFQIDLTFPELFNPELLAADDATTDENTFASLSELFEFCVEVGSNVGIILPVKRYFSGVDLTDAEELQKYLDIAEADIEIFLTRLVQGAFNGGSYPEEVVLEIGNENYESPIEYAIFSNLFLDKIEEILSGSDVNYTVAFQMSIGSWNFNTLLEEGYFSQFFDEDGVATIAPLEGYYFDSDVDVPFIDRITIVDEMMAHILGESISTIDYLRHHFLGVDSNQLVTDSDGLDQKIEILNYWLSEIEEAGADPDDVGFYVSAWTADSGNVDSYPAGLVAGTNVLLLSKFFVENGVDLAAAWGFNGSAGYWPDSNPDSVFTFTNEDTLTPCAVVFGLMAEFTVGLTIVETSRDESWSEDDPADFIENLFWSEESTVLFLSAGELGGSELLIDVDTSEYGWFTTATVYEIGTLDGEDAGPAYVEAFQVDLLDGELSVEIGQDYGIVAVVLENEGISGSELDDKITGSEMTDAIFGYLGNDEIHGWGGNDLVHGGGGADILYGNDGSDEVNGGSGTDRIWGGGDDDFIFGGSGSDLLDGQSGDDVIYGGSGSDTLRGGEGDDLLVANSLDAVGHSDKANSDNELHSSTGDWQEDVISVYEVNRLNGGDGNDVIHCSQGVDEIEISKGNDVVHGFQIGVDSIWVDGSEFDSGKSMTVLEIDEGLLVSGPDGETLFSGIFDVAGLESSVFFV